VTPLLAMFSAHADDGAREMLQRIGARDLDDTEIKEIQDLIVTSGALRAVEREIDRLVDEAHRAIAAAPIATEARTMLADLAGYVAWRDH
jgi:geranylgeranyl pyrophosphate synthase